MLVGQAFQPDAFSPATGSIIEAASLHQQTVELGTLPGGEVGQLPAMEIEQRQIEGRDELSPGGGERKRALAVKQKQSVPRPELKGFFALAFHPDRGVDRHVDSWLSSVLALRGLLSKVALPSIRTFAPKTLRTSESTSISARVLDDGTRNLAARTLYVLSGP